jgi:hypothetical protein
MKDEFDYKFDLLMKEIDMLQGSIRAFQTTLFMIKGWAITTYSAIVLFALKEHQPRMLWFCGAMVLLFWVLDATFRKFQRTSSIRYYKIEHFLRTGFSTAVKQRNFEGLIHIPDIAGSVSFSNAERRRRTAPWRGAFHWNTMFLYLAMLLLLVALYRTS